MSVKIADFVDSREDRMKALMDLPQTPFIPDAGEVLNPEKTVRIGLNYAGVTYEHSFYPSLGARALSSSMAVIAYNPATGASGLAHLTHEGNVHAISSAGEEALRMMLTRIGGAATPVRIVGPNLRGPVVDGFVNDVLGILAEYDADIQSADFRGKESVHSVAVHAGMWPEGLVRGSINVFTPAAKGSKGEEMSRRIAEMVDLSAMIHLPNVSGTRIVYNGEDAVEYTHEPGVI
ncbi:MAG: hypothetical protein H6858_01390 [Rhodospirillales bacterium]|nr:hypothetical protein [Alphaproteobacteria bacterium]MCB1840059.1 hypothetical protein [Alphaproteobacteria bacterium]MCB9976235.1 hypothetical protein [Rhodospirillales bacterium]